jgi:hypothetical protein
MTTSGREHPGHGHEQDMLLINGLLIVQQFVGESLAPP